MGDDFQGHLEAGFQNLPEGGIFADAVSGGDEPGFCLAGFPYDVGVEGVKLFSHSVQGAPDQGGGVEIFQADAGDRTGIGGVFPCAGKGGSDIPAIGRKIRPFQEPLHGLELGDIRGAGCRGIFPEKAFQGGEGQAPAEGGAGKEEGVPGEGAGLNAGGFAVPVGEHGDLGPGSDVDQKGMLCVADGTQEAGLVVPHRGAHQNPAEISKGQEIRGDAGKRRGQRVMFP